MDDAGGRRGPETVEDYTIIALGIDRTVYASIVFRMPIIRLEGGRTPTPYDWIARLSRRVGV